MHMLGQKPDVKVAVVMQELMPESHRSEHLIYSQLHKPLQLSGYHRIMNLEMIHLLM